MANPFDQFATDIKAAIPQSEAPVPAAPAPTDAANPSFNIMAQPAATPKPVMNAPPQQPPPPPAMGGMMGAPPPQQPPMGGMYGQPPPPGQPGAMVPSSQPPNPYGGLVGMGGPPPPAAPGGPPPFGGGMYGQPPPPAAPPAPPAAPPAPPAAPPAPPSEAPPMFPPPSDPFGAPPAAPPAAGAMVPAPASADPFGLSTPVAPAPAAPAVAADPFGAPAAPVPPPAAPVPPPAAPVPPPAAPVPPPAAPPAPPAPVADSDPFGGAFGGAAPPAPPAPPSDDPFGASAAPEAGAVVPSTAPPSDDPFGVFGTPAPAPPAPAPAASGDPWADMGFGPPVPDAAPAAPVAAAAVSTEVVSQSAPAPAAAAPPKKVGAEGLPDGGEWYDARIFTPTLGVMFFKPQELTDSLFLQTDKTLVEALDERPVVAFIVEGSSARSAGVELGHVLVKVNGIDVKNPKEASRLIKEGPRPLPLLFYVPDTTVVVAEGEHMVKYDTKETGAPVSAKDWKPKYVVIGGIIAQPWMMNMYRSKSEYDIAVIETQARRPVSVKVKQFSLQGARIQNDWQGPQMVKYKNKLHPWKYIVVLPVARNPIKISSPNLSQLKPVHEGIRRVLMAQQRGHGQQGRAAAPARQADPYARHGNSPVRTGAGHAGHRH